MPRTILGLIAEGTILCDNKESSTNSPPGYTTLETNDELLLTAASKSRNSTNRSSGLTQEFRTKCVASLFDGEQDEVGHTKTEDMFTDDRMLIKKMVGMMLTREERFRKRLKPNTFPKLYSSSYRARISVWLCDFC